MSKYLFAGFVLTALGTGAAHAQVVINEVYASHQGFDDQEYVEICGPLNTSLDGYMILMVEGEQPLNGFMDRAWSLGGLTIPDDESGKGYIVAGDAAVPNVDRVTATTNAIENGTVTIYLVQVGDVNAVLGIVGQQVDTNGDLMADFAAVAGTTVTIVDVVGLADSDYPVDVIYDNAPVLGPDGDFFPAGVFRAPDCTGPWCQDFFLDFNDVANLDKPRTPGALNTAECAPSEVGTAKCFGDGSGNACPCTNESPTAGEGCLHSGGVGMTIAGSGSPSIAADDLTMTASNCPVTNSGIFYSGKTRIELGNPLFDGLQCAGGDVRRYQGRFQDNGTVSDTGFVAQDPSGSYFNPGDTITWQYWTRDVSGGPTPCMTNANFSPGYQVTMIP